MNIAPIQRRVSSLLFKPHRCTSLSFTSVTTPPPVYFQQQKRHISISLRKFTEIRSSTEIMNDYIGDEESVRLCVARIRMARDMPLRKADINEHVKAILNAAPFRVQFMSDLRRLSDEQIRNINVPEWVSSGLLKLARIGPNDPKPQPSHQETLEDAGATLVAPIQKSTPELETTKNLAATATATPSPSTTASTTTDEATTDDATTTNTLTATGEAQELSTEAELDDGLTPEQREAAARRKVKRQRFLRRKENEKKKKIVDKTDFLLADHH